MSKEYEKARQECAKKYNEQIRSLEARIKELEVINKAQAEDLNKQVKLQRDFVKLCIFLNASEKDRKIITESVELQNAYNKLEKLYGKSILSSSFISSLSKLAKASCNGTNSIEEVISNLLSEGD